MQAMQLDILLVGQHAFTSCSARSLSIGCADSFIISCRDAVYNDAARRRVKPFNDPDCLFEIKWDGFLALLYSDNEGVRVISRKRECVQIISRFVRRSGS